MISILLGAILFGIWTIVLFYEKSIGLSMTLFAVPISLYVIYLLQKNEKIENKKAMALIIPIFLLSITYFIFNNIFFRFLNIIVIPVLQILMIISLCNKEIFLNLDFFNNFAEIVFNPFNHLIEALEKVNQLFLDQFNVNFETEKNIIKKVIRAILITIPLVIVILFLLSTADTIFGEIFVDIFENISEILGDFEISEFLIKIVLIAICSIYLLAFFYFITTKYQKLKNNNENIIKINDSLTIKMILGALNIIYLFFCIIQIKSLFLKDVNINYSEYARQGFFQLMVVSIINLITLLIAKKVETNSEQKGIYIKLMSLIMILFTFIILVSAAIRMHYYESAYGYTILRILVYFSLFTEALLLLPTIIYIIDVKIELSKIYFIIIISVYVCMNFANLDKIIAKRNVDRFFENGEIDTYYLVYSLDSDATEEIIRSLKYIEDNINNEKITKNIKEEDIKVILENLKFRYDNYIENRMDFRDFNLSKKKEIKLLEKYGIKYKYENVFGAELDTNSIDQQDEETSEVKYTYYKDF